MRATNSGGAQPFHPLLCSCPNGAGLGLTLVRSFAELHGGTVKIDSALGRGTTVTIALPESRVVTPAG